MIAALLWKEWREQRWRCILGTLVLTSIATGLVRAQLMTMPEAVALTFGPLGLVLAVFLAMGSVATERADGTWEFLTARPVSRSRILRVKWLVGAVHLVVAVLLAGIGAHMAAISRGLFDVVPVPPYFADRIGSSWALVGTSAWALWTLVGLALVSMLAWYTVLFFVLTRARNELHAGLGGVLLTLACLAWLLQYPTTGSAFVDWTGPAGAKALWTSSLFNPLSPLVFMLESVGSRLLAVGIVTVLWIAGPLWLVGRLDRWGKLT